MPNGPCALSFRPTTAAPEPQAPQCYVRLLASPGQCCRSCSTTRRQVARPIVYRLKVRNNGPDIISPRPYRATRTARATQALVRDVRHADLDADALLVGLGWTGGSSRRARDGRSADPRRRERPAPKGAPPWRSP